MNENEDVLASAVKTLAVAAAVAFLGSAVKETLGVIGKALDEDAAGKPGPSPDGPKESPEAAKMRRDIAEMEADLAELDKDIAKIDEIANPEERAQARAALPVFRQIGDMILNISRDLHQSTVKMDAALASGGQANAADVKEFVDKTASFLNVLEDVRKSIASFDAWFGGDKGAGDAASDDDDANAGASASEKDSPSDK